MSFAQYMVLKKGPLPLCLFTLYQKTAPIFYTCHTKILLAESNSNFSFCLEFCFCAKVHFTLEIAWSYCDSNTVFIVDVSRVYAISSSEDGKKQNQSVHTHCISENFQNGARKKG